MQVEAARSSWVPVPREGTPARSQRTDGVEHSEGEPGAGGGQDRRLLLKVETEATPREGTSLWLQTRTRYPRVQMRSLHQVHALEGRKHEGPQSREGVDGG